MIVCGNHKVHLTTRNDPHHHVNVAEVRECFSTPGGILTIEDHMIEDQMRSEWEAERAVEQHFESNPAQWWENEQDRLRELAFM